MSIRRGDIYFADLGHREGSEQGGRRPVLIIQNNQGNQHAPTVIVAAMTTSKTKAQLPTHTVIAAVGRMRENSLVMLEQIITLDKSRLGEFLGHAGQEVMNNVKAAILVSLDLQ